MSEPVEYGLDREYFVANGQRRSRDHENGQTVVPGRGDLGVGGLTARVFGHHQGDPMHGDQSAIASFGERPPRDDHVVIGKGWRHRRGIDQPQDVAVLRVRRKVGQRLATDGEQHRLARAIERGDGGRGVRHLGPVVSRDRRPWRAGEGDKRQIDLGTCRDCIPAHLRGKRMRGIDDMGDARVLEVGDKPGHAAETTDPLRQGLAQGPLYPSRKRNRSVDACRMQGAGELRGFGGAAEDQKVGPHV